MNSRIPDTIENLSVARLFRAAFGHLKHGVIIYDANLQVLEINERVRELLSIDAEMFAVGDNFEKLVRINAERGGYGSEGTVEERVARRMARASSFEPFHEDQHLYNDRYCEVYGQPIPEGGYVLTYTDISDRVRAEKAKNQFLAKMSHDLRTPLNGVVGMAELLEMSKLSPEQERMVTTIARSSTVLLRLIDDVLDLAQIESGKLSIENTEFDLPELLNDIVTTLQVVATEHYVKLNLDIERTLPVKLIGDPVRLAQCVMNLVGNAIKFSMQDSTLLRPVEIGAAQSDDGALVISVQDFGIGIEDEQLQKMFEPFVQSDLVKDQNQTGTGLGLSIVAELSSLMGGGIAVESEPGKGSTFFLSVPLIPASDESYANDALHENAVANISHTGALKILVVEDNFENREVLQQQLHLLDCDVDVAADGKEGFQCWQTGNYDLIFSDWNMPVLNGLEMTRLIRTEEHKHSSEPVPIVAITGNAIPGEVEQCADAGMNDYLTKPLKLADLKEKLEKFLS